ncbi:5-oxoprolinase subunit PxpB [Jeotgalibacillus marinus]|uniref:5-oxoprolinase subunit PxpB n=1 Tax=Jeotgalibacillus marinus TaxID=86667 RepID=A0ABV3Q108_9BACL
MDYSLHPLGDQAILIEFPQEVNAFVHADVQKVKRLLEQQVADWLVEIVPAFASVAVHYDIRKLIQHPLPYDYVAKQIASILEQNEKTEKPKSRMIDIPVFYGGELGPDLEEVAKQNDVTPKQVIDLHMAANYTVYMLGFAPGFPFIGGLNDKISTPRKSKPRLKIPPGSVGIAGKQTGVYPIATPGGWQIIGQTPEPLFRPDNEAEPTLLQAGDTVRFYAISEEEFRERKERNT